MAKYYLSRRQVGWGSRSPERKVSGHNRGDE